MPQRRHNPALLVGVLLREVVLLRLGLLAGFPVAARMNQFALKQLADYEWLGLAAPEVVKGAVIFSTWVLVFYANAHWLPRRWPELIKACFEEAY